MCVCMRERKRESERAHHCNQGLLQQLSAMSTGEGHCRRRCGGCGGCVGKGRVGSAAVQVKGNSKARTLKKADFMPFDILMPSLRFSLSSCSTCSFSLFSRPDCSSTQKPKHWNRWMLEDFEKLANMASFGSTRLSIRAYKRL